MCFLRGLVARRRGSGWPLSRLWAGRRDWTVVWTLFGGFFGVVVASGGNVGFSVILVVVFLCRGRAGGGGF